MQEHFWCTYLIIDVLSQWSHKLHIWQYVHSASALTSILKKKDKSTPHNLYFSVFTTGLTLPPTEKNEPTIVVTRTILPKHWFLWDSHDQLAPYLTPPWIIYTPTLLAMGCQTCSLLLAAAAALNFSFMIFFLFFFIPLKHQGEQRCLCHL